jgi:hypothetical protein
MAQDAHDLARPGEGHARKARKASRWHEATTAWLVSRAGDAVSLAALHAWLDEDDGYGFGRDAVADEYVGA